MASVCPKCGEKHGEWPSLEFQSPFYYHQLSEANKERCVNMELDFCIIRQEEQFDHYIRAIITQKVNDHCDDIDYGVWVLLNEDSFHDYSSHFNQEEHEAIYFGLLSNQIPGYGNTLSINVTIQVSRGAYRPQAVPHINQLENPFVHDYYQGIRTADVMQKIKYILGDEG